MIEGLIWPPRRTSVSEGFVVIQTSVSQGLSIRYWGYRVSGTDVKGVIRIGLDDTDHIDCAALPNISSVCLQD